MKAGKVKEKSAMVTIVSGKTRRRYLPRTARFSLSPHTTVALVLLLSITAFAGDSRFLGTIWKTNWSTPPEGFSDLFTQVTPENAGKWGAAEENQGRINWQPLDRMYEWAESADALTKQHTFVWGQQQPSWTNGFSTGEEARTAIENWIKSYMDRFGDKVDMIDVVNEPLHAKPAYRHHIGGDGSTGWDWVVWSFEMARRHAPKAKLHLNDYDILKSDSNTDNYLRIVAILKEKGLIDGIGVQGHFLENTSADRIKSNLDKLAQTGLPIHVSEYDVNIGDDGRQKRVYEEQFTVFWEHDAVVGVTLWGYQEGKMWRGNGYLVRSDGSWRPALEWLYDYVYGDETRIGEKRKSPAIAASPAVAGKKVIMPYPWKKRFSSVPAFQIDGKKTLPGTIATQYLLPVPGRPREHF